MIMAYCKKCGSELPDDAKYCTKCGESVEQKKKWGWAILGLFLFVDGLTVLFGIVGLIIGLIISAVALLIYAASK